MPDANIARDGQLYVTLEGPGATYSAATSGYSPPATPTDLFTIQGKANTRIRITRIWISGRAHTETTQRLTLIKYSTIFSNSAASTSVLTGVAHDSNDPKTANAIVNIYTSCPSTLGAAVGYIHDDLLPLNLSGLSATQPFAATPWVRL